MAASHHPLEEPEAFSTLFNLTHKLIYRYIYGLLGGPVEEVEDLTSETFTRAWKGRDKFFGDYPDATRWLFTIARHLVIDTYRKKSNRQEDTILEMDDVVLESSLSPNQYSPEELVIRREMFKKLWRLIQYQPVDRREMLVLRYMIGWQVKQIAVYLDMNENTVSVYLRRSLEQIRHAWFDMGDVA